MVRAIKCQHFDYMVGEQIEEDHVAKSDYDTLATRIHVLEAAIKSANGFIECLRGNPPGDHIYECLSDLREVMGSTAKPQKEAV
jgi:hypothetical protein